jgi:hypothetical protein
MHGCCPSWQMFDIVKDAYSGGWKDLVFNFVRKPA